MNKIIFLLFLAILLVSCQNQEKSNKAIFTFDVAADMRNYAEPEQVKEY